MADHEADGSEVCKRVVTRRLVQAHVERDVGKASYDEVVAVGSGAGDELRSDQRARAGTVLHHEGLPRLLAELLRKDAPHQIEAAARGGRDDDAHRTRRVVLGRRQGERREGGQGATRPAQSQASEIQHGFHIRIPRRFSHTPGPDPSFATLSACRAPSAPALLRSVQRPRRPRPAMSSRTSPNAETRAGASFRASSCRLIAGAAYASMYCLCICTKASTFTCTPIARGSSSIWGQTSAWLRSSRTASKASRSNGSRRASRECPGAPRKPISDRATSSASNGAMRSARSCAMSRATRTEPNGGSGPPPSGGADG